MNDENNNNISYTDMINQGLKYFSSNAFDSTYSKTEYDTVYNDNDREMYTYTSTSENPANEIPLPSTKTHRVDSNNYDYFVSSDTVPFSVGGGVGSSSSITSSHIYNKISTDHFINSGHENKIRYRDIIKMLEKTEYDNNKFVQEFMESLDNLNNYIWAVESIILNEQIDAMFLLDKLDIVDKKDFQLIIHHVPDSYGLFRKYHDEKFSTEFIEIHKHRRFVVATEPSVRESREFKHAVHKLKLKNELK